MFEESRGNYRTDHQEVLAEAPLSMQHVSRNLDTKSLRIQRIASVIESVFNLSIIARNLLRKIDQ